MSFLLWFGVLRQSTALTSKARSAAQQWLRCDARRRLTHLALAVVRAQGAFRRAAP